MPQGEGGVTPWTSRQFIAESRGAIQAQSSGQLELPVSLMVVSLDCDGNPGRAGKTTGENMQSAHKKGLNPTTLLLTAVRQ